MECYKKIWSIKKKPFATANFYSEFSFDLSELMRQVAVLTFAVNRNKAKYITARAEKALEISQKYKEANWKEITQAGLDRELDIIFIKEIQKQKIDSAYADLENDIVKAYKLFLEGIKMELITDMSIQKQDSTAISTQNQIDNDFPFSCQPCRHSRHHGNYLVNSTHRTQQDQLSKHTHLL